MNLKKYTGYHGTDKNSAEKIMKTNFTINYGHQGFLGKGVYFFEEDKELSREYAKHRHSTKIINILECILEVPNNKVFDTTKDEDAEKFSVYKEVVKETLIKEKINLKTGNRHHFDGKVYDLIVKKEGYILIRATTFTPSLSDRELGIMSSNVHNGVELCLRNVSRVIDKCISK